MVTKFKCTKFSAKVKDNSPPSIINVKIIPTEASKVLKHQGNSILHATFVTCRQSRILLKNCRAGNAIETALEFQVQVVQKIAHEFVGILLLIAPETNRNSLSLGRLRLRSPAGRKEKHWAGLLPCAQSTARLLGLSQSLHGLHKISQREKNSAT